MSLINLVTPEQAQGPVAEAYKAIEQSFGSVPQPVQLWGVSPGMLPVFMSAVGYFNQHPTLNPALLLWIRYLVAEGDACAFCIDYNKALLMEKADATLEQLNAAKQDPASVPLSDKDKGLLLLVLKAVKTPLQVTADDVAKAKADGFSDRDLFEAVAGAAFVTMDDLLINTFKVA